MTDTIEALDATGLRSAARKLKAILKEERSEIDMAEWVIRAYLAATSAGEVSEPVAWRNSSGGYYHGARRPNVHPTVDLEPLYAAPPALAQPAPSDAMVEAAQKIIDTHYDEFDVIDQYSASSIVGEDRQGRLQLKGSFIAALERLRAALSEAPREAEGWKPTHRHVKRGSEYMLLGIGKMQAEDWFFERFVDIGVSKLARVDMQEVAIYRGQDGQMWVRPVEEFNDGRFTPLPSAPTGGE